MAKPDKAARDKRAVDLQLSFKKYSKKINPKEAPNATSTPSSNWQYRPILAPVIKGQRNLNSGTCRQTYFFVFPNDAHV